MNKTLIGSISLSFALGLGLTTEASAQNVCEASKPMSGQRLLRRLSLDLRDTVPNLEEIDAQRSKEGVDESAVEGMLNSDRFLSVMRRYHRELLWPNIDDVEIVPDTHTLFPFPLENNEVWASPVRSVFVRAAGNANLYMPCKDEPAQFDGNGRVIAEPVMMGADIVAYQEGWVEVEPYWAPGTLVKVCAFDAMPNLQATACPGPVERYPFADPICENIAAGTDQFTVTPLRNSQVDCSSPFSILAPECGCGPNLQYCQTQETAQVIRDSLFEQQNRLIEKVIREDRPYHEILTDVQIDFNGPVAHYLRHQSALTFDLTSKPDSSAPPPAQLTYADVDTWMPVQRTDRHAGVLTTPGYLMRFATWRGRAHRFYNAFECSSFIPNGPLPSPFAECSQQDDLTKRCGCDSCHIPLEPMAAHWGRFAENGFASLDEQEYPRNAFITCTPPVEDALAFLYCFRLYNYDEGELNAYVYRTDEQVANIEMGPGKLVRESVEAGRFGGCTTRKMWTQFMRRAPTLDEEAEIIPELTETFQQSNYNIKTLIKAIVTHPAYGRQL